MQSSDRKNYVAALAEKYGRRLRRFISTRARNNTDVADLAQEVFLRLLRVDNVDAVRSPESYLFTIASHVLYQHNLNQIDIPAMVDLSEMQGELQLVAQDDPSASVDLQQRMEQLKTLLEPLPAKVRTALVLHRFAGYTIEEIARQLGVSRPTAKRYLAAGIAHCRNHSFDTPAGSAA